MTCKACNRVNQTLSHLQPTELTSSACCAVPASADFKPDANYAGNGRKVQIGNFEAYVTGQPGKKAIVHIYDICLYVWGEIGWILQPFADISSSDVLPTFSFRLLSRLAVGFHPNAFQVADVMSNESNALVVMPDLMKGGAWPISQFPPTNDAERNKMFGHIMKAGSWPKVVKPRMLEVIKYLKGLGVESVGVMGFCWGSKMCMQTVGDRDFDTVKGAVLFHPSMLENSDAENALKPAAVFDSKDEPDLTKFYEILKDKHSATIRKRYDDQPHGWVGATANFANPAEKKAADEVVGLAADWFKKLL